MCPININIRQAFKWPLLRFDVNVRPAVSLISKAHRYETNNANMTRFALARCEKNLINLIESVTILMPVSRVWVTNMWVKIGESVYWFFTNCNYNVLLHFQDCCSSSELPWMTSSLRILAMEIIPIPSPADYHSTGEPSTDSCSITCLQDNTRQHGPRRKRFFLSIVAHSWLWYIFNRPLPSNARPSIVACGSVGKCSPIRLPAMTQSAIIYIQGGSNMTRTD
jgi:hypothetical protein